MLRTGAPCVLLKRAARPAGQAEMPPCVLRALLTWGGWTQAAGRHLLRRSQCSPLGLGEGGGAGNRWWKGRGLCLGIAKDRIGEATSGVGLLRWPLVRSRGGPLDSYWHGLLGRGIWVFLVPKKKGGL